jgi:hypothetical protein
VKIYISLLPTPRNIKLEKYNVSILKHISFPLLPVKQDKEKEKSIRGLIPD